MALYLACLAQSSNSPSPVLQAFYSINWAHSIVGSVSPTEAVLVKNVLEGAKRSLSRPIQKKEPITPELLEKMCDSLSKVFNLYNQRSICACLIAYAGFLRSSELLSIRANDVIFHDNYMSIAIRQSKTDIYRDGDSIVIAKTGTKLCPVTNLQMYINKSEIDVHCDTFLFRSLNKCEDGYVFRKDNKPLTYTRMRELFIEAFSAFVPNIKKYGLHSLRCGGASSAANFRISDRLFKRHGRWKSENAKDGYVKDSIENRLSVSKHLGL